MKIGFIGAGCVGTAFGMYLKAKGFELLGYYSRTPESADNAARLSGSRRYLEEREIAEECDILFITTSDSQIELTCNSLAEKGYLRQGLLVVHMSGALSSTVLHSAQNKGCFTYSLHPIQSFADNKQAFESLPGTVFSLEGDVERINLLQDLLMRTGNSFFTIDAEQKVLYHAATCIFSNYLTTLIEEGLQLFATVGIPRGYGLAAALPLICGTVDNIALLGTEKALTGPIARGDTDTVRQHLRTISQASPDSMEFYKLMATRTLNLAKQHKLKDPAKIRALAELLDR
jgi:predicted short-subunit dehydrogenase-like oxidoreductase (DUF2520 family)